MSAVADTEESNFHLKWHSHRSTLNEALSSLLASEAFTDVTLAVSATDIEETNGESQGNSCAFFRAHRVILSACSPYFSRLLSETCSTLWPPRAHSSISTIVSPPPHSHPLVILPPGIGPSALRILLRFIYTGTAEVPHDQLVSVLHAGEILQIRGLCKGENGQDEQDPLNTSSSPNPSSENGAGEFRSLSVDKDRIVDGLVENVLENGKHSELRIKDVRSSKSNLSAQGTSFDDPSQRDVVRGKFKKLISGKIKHSSVCKEKKSVEEGPQPCQSAMENVNSGEGEPRLVTVKQEPIDEDEGEEEAGEGRERGSLLKANSWWDGEGSRDSAPPRMASPSVFSPMHVTIKPGDRETWSRSAPTTYSLNTSVTCDQVQLRNSETVIQSFQELSAKDSNLDCDSAETLSEDKEKCMYIRNIAENSIDGLIVLAAFRSKKELEQVLKIKLARIIILHELGLDTNKVITSDRFQFLADCVRKEFNQDPNLWYSPSMRSGSKRLLPSGKLYDQYTSMCKELRKYGIRDRRRGIKRSVEDAALCDSIEDLAQLPPCTLSKEEIEERLHFLQLEVKYGDIISEYWKETVRVRQTNLRSEAADQSNYMYLNTYPVLKQPEGYKLLQTDFRLLFPQAYDRITTHWDSFVEKVKEQLSIENISVPAPCSDAELLHLFAQLITPFRLKMPNGKLWKPSRKDILDRFLCYSKTDDPLKHCEADTGCCRARGLTVQLFPMIIGESLANIHTNYLVIDKTPVKLPTTRDVFAAAFYAYHALNCSYPLQSARLWVIVEKALFGMEDVKHTQSQTISKIPEVKRLISVLKDIELSNDGEGEYGAMEGKSGTEVEMLDVEEEEDEEFGQTMPLTCDFCSETFLSAAAWVRHLKTHPPSMLPNDPDPWRNSRKARQQWRSGGEGASMSHRTHVCPSCSKRFYSNASLLIHIRTHTGEKPFECDVCHKGFNVKSNLIRHMRTLHGKIVSPSQVEEKA